MDHQDLIELATKLNIKVDEGVIEKIREAHFEDGFSFKEIKRRYLYDFYDLGWLRVKTAKKNQLKNQLKNPYLASGVSLGIVLKKEFRNEGNGTKFFLRQ